MAGGAGRERQVIRSRRVRFAAGPGAARGRGHRQVRDGRRGPEDRGDAAARLPRRGRDPAHDSAGSQPTVPDKFRLLIIGVDDDVGPTSAGQSSPSLNCETGGNVEPRKAGRGEWNVVIRDLDLTRYPGARASEPFVWRSQPLSNGSRVMFEVRGAVTVTRE